MERTASENGKNAEEKMCGRNRETGRHSGEADAGLFPKLVPAFYDSKTTSCADALRVQPDCWCSARLKLPAAALLRNSC